MATEAPNVSGLPVNVHGNSAVVCGPPEASVVLPPPAAAPAGVPPTPPLAMTGAAPPAVPPAAQLAIPPVPPPASSTLPPTPPPVPPGPHCGFSQAWPEDYGHAQGSAFPMAASGVAPSLHTSGWDVGYEPPAKRMKGMYGGYGKGGGKGKASGDPGEEGEIRFYHPECAQRAAQMLNGSVLNGSRLAVHMDNACWDATKVIVTGMSPGLAWQELKDHFCQVGQVHYANINRLLAQQAREAQHAAAIEYSGMYEKGEKGGGKAPRSTGDPLEEGEVRFYTRDYAEYALTTLDLTIHGHPLTVKRDDVTTDGTKLIISNMPPGVAWHDIKNLFSQAGPVHYANIGRTDKGKGKGFGVAQPGQPCVGEVRFSSQEEAHKAQRIFHGHPFKNTTLVVKPDLSSKAGTKILIFNLPIGTDWSEIKELFNDVGTIEFCGIDCAKNKGKGKHGGKGYDKGYGHPYYGDAYGGDMWGCQGGHGGYSGSMGNCGGSMGHHEGSHMQMQMSPHMQSSGSQQHKPCVGEVRFTDSTQADAAIELLSGSQMGEQVISVVRDRMCKDGSRILVMGISPATPRQVLVEHFSQVGTVAWTGMRIGGQPVKDYNEQGIPIPGQTPAPAPEVEIQPPAAPVIGEVRYTEAAFAHQAIQMYNGTIFNGVQISVVLDRMAKDGTRVLVMGLPPGTFWKDLKDHFAQVGSVAFAGIKPTGQQSGTHASAGMIVPSQQVAIDAGAQHASAQIIAFDTSQAHAVQGAMNASTGFSMQACGGQCQQQPAFAMCGGASQQVATPDQATGLASAQLGLGFGADAQAMWAQGYGMIAAGMQGQALGAFGMPQASFAAVPGQTAWAAVPAGWAAGMAAGGMFSAV
eukprot:TRINITY_DN6865_c0_g1_i1.p1 TRINITY_DN6865_c0_g1~~TRINITY_DN6865_c0_g1_i1.p1  ORF type:complete len:859 (-),score=142.58 TRINITY_DN6865_c0_g1_i1:92-2668(-)